MLCTSTQNTHTYTIHTSHTAQPVGGDGEQQRLQQAPEDELEQVVGDPEAEAAEEVRPPLLVEHRPAGGRRGGGHTRVSGVAGRQRGRGQNVR